MTDPDRPTEAAAELVPAAVTPPAPATEPAATEPAPAAEPADVEPADGDPEAPAIGEAASEPAPAPAPAGEERVMTLVDHLTELRDRIIRSILAVGLGAVIGFLVSDPVVSILYDALPDGSPPLQVFSPGDAFAIRIRISLIIGIILAMPVLLYQLWAFVSPGLTPRERRVVGPWIPLSLVFFTLGVVVAWVVLPFAVEFLTSFLTSDMSFLPSAREYFDFVSTLFIAFGLVLQFPILLYGLSRVGIVTSRSLGANRRIAILVIAIFAAAVTPGGDLVSPITLGVTMYALYEGTIFAVRRSGK